MIGIDPGMFTIRELLVMAEGRSKANWSHTSSILALVANVNRDPKKTKPFHPSDFDPHAHHQETEKLPIMKIKELKGMFINGS